jgi:hypothetical protein
MHAYDEAFLFVGQVGVANRAASALENSPTMLSQMGLFAPAELDRKSLLRRLD